MSTVLLSALLIFFLRVLDIALYTLRLLMVTRGRKALAWVFSFIKSLIFVITIQLVLQDLDNWLKILGYATGFATGLVVGMWLEERIALGLNHLRIISPKRGAELTERLRDEGYAVTEIPSRGKEGVVTILDMDVLRKKTSKIVNLVNKIDPEAFITSRSVRSAQRGFFRR
jgi:uncharacterized protein YebE (UPF0316 family)